MSLLRDMSARYRSALMSRYSERRHGRSKRWLDAADKPGLASSQFQQISNDAGFSSRQ
jgi:hypothetical protein